MVFSANARSAFSFMGIERALELLEPSLRPKKCILGSASTA
jgi:hypothetical protein